MNENKITPMKAIRMKCLDCCMDQVKEVRLCSAKDCPLHPFRLGKNPYRAKREYTEEERKKIAERLHKSKSESDDLEEIDEELEDSED